MDSDEQYVKSSVYADERITKYTEGKTIVKEIFVKNKILNIVVK